MMSGSAESGGDDSMGDGRKGGKRELSQSKRAAQNRAAQVRPLLFCSCFAIIHKRCNVWMSTEFSLDVLLLLCQFSCHRTIGLRNNASQRAFRQRKEGYIKKLEEQVRELHALEDNYKAIQTENYSLREYIIHLQSRLIESHGEFPQPPANINLSHPREDPMSQLHRHAEVPTAPMGMSAMSQLQASAAQAVADLGNTKRQQDEVFMGQNKRFRQDNDEPSDDLISRQLQDGLPRS
jgi:hypothetical protein